MRYNSGVTTRQTALNDAATQFIRAGIVPNDARAEAAILLRHVTGASREELFLRPHTVLDDADAEAFADLVARRAAREPLAYLVGTRDFYGLRFAVTPDVLIPRPETEGVVEQIVAANPETVLDLCTGSGAIAVAVAVALPAAHVWATDISDAALVVAKQNADRHGVAERLTFLAGDLFKPIPNGLRFAVIAANPPYIAPETVETLEPEVKNYEPRIALGVHSDALHFYRRIAGESAAFLTENGRVVVEVGYGQADAVRELFADAGFADVETFADLAGIPRVIVAKRKKGA